MRQADHSLTTDLRLNDWRTSKMGYKFDLNSDVWMIGGSETVNLERVREIDNATFDGLRQSLSRYAEELSASATLNVFAAFNACCDYTKSTTVSVMALSKWRASLNDESEYRLGVLKGFLLAWNEWGFPGVDDDVADYLDELRLKGNTKGKPVSRSCPYSGPFTKLELGALLNWVSNAFLTGLLNLTQYAYFVVLALTGRRSVQIRALRTCDLKCKENADGRDHIVMFPRGKQRGIGFREAFRALAVTEDLYLLLDNQATASQRAVEDVLGKKLSPELARQIPLFLEFERVEALCSVEDLVTQLRDTPDYLHMTSATADAVLRDVGRKNLARSERTGEFINFTSRRFRYTKGTNLARRGITGVALAYALDHSDTQQIDVYTENTEEIAEQIDEIMAPALAPIAQAYAGTLIDSERDALRANDPHSRVKNDSAHAIGNCGTHAFCASGYRACYTCVNFQAWRDAPHEEVRDEIVAERNRQREIGISPEVIQATDRLLLAVEQVISMCRKARSIAGLGVAHG